MPSNVGTLDRLIRIVLGLLLIAIPVSGSWMPWGWVGLIGVVPLLTATVGFCPAYRLLGLCTKSGQTAAR